MTYCKGFPGPLSLAASDIADIAAFIRGQASLLAANTEEERDIQLFKMENWVKLLDAEFFKREAPGADRGRDYPVEDLVECLVAAMKLRDRAQLQETFLHCLRVRKRHLCVGT